jgi:NADP-dependent 3-hydroxy acid dehydrogenase YdfG
MSQSLSQNNVIVTGGATGIGFAIACAFAQEGANVAIGSRRQSAIEEAIQQCSRSNPAAARMIGSVVDVADRSSVDAFFAWAKQSLGKVDILVNAAGVNIKDRSMAVMKPSQWDEVMAINATGAYNCIYAVLGDMRASKAGLIINISSVAGKRALALGGVAYSASKFAMTALGTCISNEVGSEGVRVTNVYPGEVDTPILEHRPTPVTEEHRQSILRPDDIAKVIIGIATLPTRVHVPEVVVKPVHQQYY